MVQFHDHLMQLLRLFEMFQFCQHIFHQLAASLDLLSNDNTLGCNLCHLINIKSLQDLLNLVCNLIDILAELRQIFPVKRRHESLRQRHRHFMLFLVSRVFMLMHDLQHFTYLIRLKLFQTLHQISGRPACTVGSLNEIFKIKTVRFTTCHTLFSSLYLSKISS